MSSSKTRVVVAHVVGAAVLLVYCHEPVTAARPYGAYDATYAGSTRQLTVRHGFWLFWVLLQPCGLSFCVVSHSFSMNT